MAKSQGFANLVVFQNVLEPLILSWILSWLLFRLPAGGATGIFRYSGGDLVLRMTSHGIGSCMN